MLLKPSNNRNRKTGQKILSSAKVEGSRVKLFNIRSFQYINWETVEKYLNEEYDLNNLVWAYFYSVPFWVNDIFSHVMIGFDFCDKEIVLSVEARRLQWEDYSVFKWLLPWYNVIYIWWTVNDLVWFRTNIKNIPVYKYRLKLTLQILKMIFIDLIHRTNHLYDNPEFYNTLDNNCITNIAQFIIKYLGIKKIPLNYIMFSGEIDKQLYKKGILDSIYNNFDDLKRNSILTNLKL